MPSLQLSSYKTETCLDLFSRDIGPNTKSKKPISSGVNVPRLICQCIVFTSGSSLDVPNSSRFSAFSSTQELAHRHVNITSF